MKKCKFESENGECLINECMYWPIEDKDKYNLCESVRKSLDDTTTDCEDCKARIRNEAIDEYSNKLWKLIEMERVDCRFDFTIDDLKHLEFDIKGLAEELKENQDE